MIRTPHEDHRRAGRRPFSAASTTIGCLFAMTLMTACTTEKTEIARQYAFWPPFPDEPRMQFITSYRFSEDIEPAKSGFDEMVFGKTRRVLPIRKPYGVEMWNGRIYVCDTKNAGVVVLDVKQRETRLMGTSGSGRLTSPTDVAVSPEGTKYVTDAQRGVVYAYDADERHVGSFGFPDFKPTGIACRGDELFVCDFESRQIVVLDRFNGSRLRAFGEIDIEVVEAMRWPLGIDLDDEGNVYVSDVLQCRVQKYSPDGELLSTFGTVGTAPGDFVRPKHLAVDADGIVYVVDAGFANVQMFNDEHRLLMHFGTSGPHPGAMHLPAGVCINEDDMELFADAIHPYFQAERLVLVTNQFGANKVSVYAMGQLREGRTAQDIAESMVQIETGLREEGEVVPLTGTPEEPAPGSTPGMDESFDEPLPPDKIREPRY